MINATAALQELLASGWFVVTDLWRFTLINGTVLYLTGGQRPLTYGGNTYAAGVTILRDKVRQALGFEVSTLKVEMASESYLINGQTLPQAVTSGVFDHAKVLLCRAYHGEFADAPAQVIPRFEGSIAGQEPGTRSVVLNFKSLPAQFSEQYPTTVYGPPCNNQVYDSRCGLSKAAFTESGTTASGATAGSLSFTSSSTGGTTIPNFYALGVITYTSGALAGQSRGIASSTLSGSVATLQLLQPFPEAPAAGDTFTVYPGCQRTMDCCLNNFNNLSKYRGYPLVPRAETIL